MKLLLAVILFFTAHLKAYELEIFTAEEPLKFQTELAVSATEQALGLMNRRDLKERSGMLFIMSPKDSAAMWMKNTPLSLDMIFINPQGIITHIEKSTTPYSTHVIGPYKNITGIFEVLGGTCEKNNISIGDKVSFALFQ